jgi:hypothetical protein
VVSGECKHLDRLTVELIDVFGTAYSCSGGLSLPGLTSSG